VPKFNKNFKFLQISGGFAVFFLLSVLSCGRENIAGGPSDVETYGFTFSGGASYTFPAGVEDVYTAGTHEVTITNTGSRATGVISIELSEADAFELSDTTLASIAPEGDASFSVSTITGLSGGTYTATITASGEGGFEEEYDVSFTVGDPVLELTIVSGGPLGFGEKIAGYAAAPDAQEITVENTGNQPLTGVAVNGGTAYSASPSTATLAVGERIAFAVNPKTGLVSSDYSAVLSVEAAGGARPAEFEAVFSVRNGKITVQSVANGSIVVEQTAVPGGTVMLTATPSAGYALSKTIQPNTITYTRHNATRYSFSMPFGADVNLVGNFIEPRSNQMATGGEVNMVDAGGGTFKEVHRFTYNSGNDVDGQTPYTLDFSGTVSGLSAKVIIAAGGGGGGGSSGTGDGGGGGGGGGLIYEDYAIGGDITVRVGKGGAGGISEENFANATTATEGVSGNDSVFGTRTAIGGGGGGGGFNNRYNGKNGGSGGGGGSGSNNGSAGNSTGGGQGNAGGVATMRSSLDAGGGGGGAVGAGQNGGDGPGGAGGTGRTITEIPYWTSLVLCRGGNGGNSSTSQEQPPAAPTLFGEGGAAGPAGGSTPIDRRAGRAGKEGVVIVWWDYIAP
jgi:hypothetical protein